MSFVAQLHAYQDLGSYEEPILSEAWYEIDNPSVSPDSASVESLFREIAAAFAKEFGDELDPSILNDFNWGDFIDEIPDEFLGHYGVRPLHNEEPVIVFAHHDELILE